MNEYAGFWIRVGAYIIDAIILGIAQYVIAMILGIDMMASADPMDPTASAGGSMLLNVISLGMGIAYFAGLESSNWQATVGKKALGLVVTDLNGQRISFLKALGRYLAKILSALILLIGFIMVAFTERKQGLHDMLAGTLVYKGQPSGSDPAVFS
ncbi:MAG: RDD family protein [Sphingomonadaceae bacterium]|nr:RDD family protein [Sphingomonadaceae bacterium]